MSPTDIFKPKLQILIPQYKETEAVIKPLLDSIAVQQHIDFNSDISVIIVNDGTDVILDQMFLNQYPYRIDYILAEHGGVSSARNIALRNATAEYVMFCDADDMFYITHALWIIFKNIKKEDFDIMNSAFLEEVFYEDNSFAELAKHDQDRTFVHGKVYRREYLIDNDIFFDERLTIHEDMYFNTLALMLTENVQYQDTAFYLWKFRKDSVCRDDPNYTMSTYPNLIESNKLLIEQFLKRGKTEFASKIMCFLTLDTYYSMQLPLWHKKENIHYRDETEKCFAELYGLYGKLFFDAPIEYRRKMSSGLREKTVKCGMVMELIGFPEWIGHIEELVEELFKEQE